MPKQYTFEDVCAFVGEHHSKLLAKAEHLLALVIIASPIALPAALPVLSLLTAKSDLVKLGKDLFAAITKKRKKLDFLAEHERMQIAYTLICFTAFFDAFAKLLPKLQEKLNLSDKEQQFLLKQALEGHCEPDQSGNDSAVHESARTGRAVSFPHPMQDLKDLREDQKRLYVELTSGLLKFLGGLKLWEDLPGAERAKLKKSIEQLPGKALVVYEAQYRNLATKFEAFRIWSNLHEHKKTQAKVSEAAVAHAAMLRGAKQGLDIGFAKLGKAIATIPGRIQAHQANQIVDGLKNNYRARLDEPVITEEFDVQPGEVSLTFPAVKTCFIPQSFKVLHHAEASKSLEPDTTWQQIPKRPGLNAFLMSYFSSPYSLETPLIVLGHPGSGKSLLTKVLAARLMSDAYTPIRVPLREVDSDAEIEDQIIQGIKRVAKNKPDSWATLSGTLTNRPPIVILDGFDELLQATGHVYRNYIQKVRNFQRGEMEQLRPLRIILTSRITLIDKAKIPNGSTILRLCRFDEKQQQRWCRVWNETNASNFQSAKQPIQPFELPDNDKVLDLAAQPLLLLMLAIYDSHKNSLRVDGSLDRCSLYNNLIRRFVQRERRKEDAFRNQTEESQQEEIETETARLGVAATGMFIRDAVHIQAADLDLDLRFSKLERTTAGTSHGRKLSQAELLLGSFFFVHKSKATLDEEIDQGDVAFEFLHNTFGEFLAADYITRRTLGQLDDVALERERAKRKRESRKMQYDERWLSSLSFALLSSRPLVLEMVQEWAPRLLATEERSREDFATDVDWLFYGIVRELLSGEDLHWLKTRRGVRIPDPSLLCLAARFSFNLAMLTAALSGGTYAVDESQLLAESGGTEGVAPRAWDRLAQLWMSQISIEDLAGAATSLVVEREGEYITLGSFSESGKLRDFSTSGRLSQVYLASNAVGHQPTMALSGYLLRQEKGDPAISRDKAKRILAAEEFEHTSLEIQQAVEAYLEGKELSFAYAPGSSLSGGDKQLPMQLLAAAELSEFLRGGRSYLSLEVGVDSGIEHRLYLHTSDLGSLGARYVPSALAAGWARVPKNVIQDAIQDHLETVDHPDFASIELLVENSRLRELRPASLVVLLRAIEMAPVGRVPRADSYVGAAIRILLRVGRDKAIRRAVLDKPTLVLRFAEVDPSATRRWLVWDKPSLQPRVSACLGEIPTDGAHRLYKSLSLLLDLAVVYRVLCDVSRFEAVFTERPRRPAINHMKNDKRKRRRLLSSYRKADSLLRVHILYFLARLSIHPKSFCQRVVEEFSTDDKRQLRDLPHRALGFLHQVAATAEHQPTLRAIDEVVREVQFAGPIMPVSGIEA